MINNDVVIISTCADSLLLGRNDQEAYYQNMQASNKLTKMSCNSEREMKQFKTFMMSKILMLCLGTK